MNPLKTDSGGQTGVYRATPDVALSFLISSWQNWVRHGFAKLLLYAEHNLEALHRWPLFPATALRAPYFSFSLFSATIRAKPTSTPT